MPINALCVTCLIVCIAFQSKNCRPSQCTGSRQTCRSCGLQSELVCAIFIQRRRRERCKLMHNCCINAAALTNMITFKQMFRNCTNLLH